MRGLDLALAVELEARGPAQIEPQPAVLRALELVQAAHHVPRSQHRERVHVGDKVLDVGVGRLQHDVLWRSRLHDAAAFHDGDAVADLERFLEVVADKDDRLLDRLLQLQELVLQLGADQGIERRERLIHQEDRCIGGEGAGEPDALLHAARELVHVLVRPGVEANELQLPIDALLELGLRNAGKLEPEADILAHRPPGQECELLKNHGDLLLADMAQRGGIARGHIDHAVAVLHEHLPARHFVEPVDSPEHGRLARARQAHEDRDLALVDGEARVRCAEH